MNQPKTASKIPSILLIICGLAAIFSLFLPWGNSRNHWAHFYEYLIAIIDVVSYEDDEIYWEDAFFYFGKGAPAIAPAFFGIALIFGGLFSKTKLGTFFSTLSYLILIGVVFGSLLSLTIITWADREDSNNPYYYLYGVIAAAILGGTEKLLYWKAIRKKGGISDAIHVVPLTLFGVGSLVAGIALWNNDQWHAIDYVVLGAALIIALVALWLRRKPASAS